MRAWTLAVLLGLLVSLPVLAETVTWDCNPEPDMKVYRGERATGDTGSWGVLFTQPHVPGCETLSWTNPEYVAPGQKRYRLFAVDTSGNASLPSGVVQFTVPTSPIGNPSGQTEPSLPPSPYVVAQNPPPPVSPPPVVVPPPPPVVKPGDVTGFAVGSITQTSAIIAGNVPAGAKVNLRYMKAPLGWGAATSADCDSLPCTLSGLTPDTTYEAQCIPYFGKMNQGAIYGNFCPTITVKTLPMIVTPPTPVPPSVPPPVPPTPPPASLEPRVKALEERAAAIEEMGAVLDEEMKEVRATMRALCRALKGNCP